MAKQKEPDQAPRTGGRPRKDGLVPGSPEALAANKARGRSPAKPKQQAQEKELTVPELVTEFFKALADVLEQLCPADHDCSKKVRRSAPLLGRLWATNPAVRKLFTVSDGNASPVPVYIITGVLFAGIVKAHLPQKRKAPVVQLVPEQSDEAFSDPEINYESPIAPDGFEVISEFDDDLPPGDGGSPIGPAAFSL